MPMFHWKCDSCHHEWDASYSRKCDWCQGDSVMLSENKRMEFRDILEMANKLHQTSEFKQLKPSSKMLH